MTAKSLDGTRSMAAAAVGALAVAAGFYALVPDDAQGYLLFHTVMELAAVIASFAIFTVGWYSRDFLSHNWLFLLGVAYGAVGLLDLLHAMSYHGMPLTSTGMPDLTTKIWLAARLIEAGAFLVAMRKPEARFDGLRTVLTIAGVSALVMAAIGLGLFPTAFEPGKGLTSFKIVSEYGVMAAFAVAGLLLWRKSAEMDRLVWRLVLGSLVLRIAQEACFTLYNDAFALSNAAGHWFKLAATVLLFRAIVEQGLRQPQRLIAGLIERERQWSAALERQNRVRAMLLDASPDLMFLYGPDLRYRYVNSAAAQALGIPQPAWTGRHWRELGLPAEMFDKVEAGVRDCFATGQPATTEIGFDGKTYEYKMVPIQGDAGLVENVLVASRDMTERHQQEQMLRAAVETRDAALAEAGRASMAKSRFLAAASHDLRQPSQATRLFLEVATMRAEQIGATAVLEPIRKAQQAHDGMESLLQTLLSISTLEAGTVKVVRGRFRIDHLLADLQAEMDELASKQGLELRFHAAEATVDSDPVLLQRILRNLMHNALRYTESGGVLVGCRRRGSHLRIEVWDTGIGIPADKLAEVFEDFVQVGNDERARDKGLGLGLSVVRRTAALLGHRVELKSRLGRGSVFAVEVPLAEQETPAKSRPALEYA